MVTALRSVEPVQDNEAVGEVGATGYLGDARMHRDEITDGIVEAKTHFEETIESERFGET